MKSIYETMGGEYRQDGDYLLPNFETPENPKVGVWGERRRKYLCNMVYTLWWSSPNDIQLKIISAAHDKVGGAEFADGRFFLLLLSDIQNC